MVGITSHQLLTSLKKLNPKKILEIGTYLGGSTSSMAQICSAHIICVDTWLGWADKESKNPLYLVDGYPSLFYRFVENMKLRGHAHRISAVPLPSSEAFEGDRFDFVYIDGSHRFRDVLYDLENSWGLLNSPGAIMLDDYENEGWPGVRVACDVWLYLNPNKHEVIDKKMVIWK